MSALDIGNPDGEDEAQKAKRLAARAARFNKSAPGKRNKEVSIYYRYLLRQTIEQRRSLRMLEPKNGRRSKLKASSIRARPTCRLLSR